MTSQIDNPAIRNARFWLNWQKVYSLGPRASGEFLAEIAESYLIRTPIEARLEDYAKLTIEQVVAAGAGAIPTPALRLVREESCPASEQ